MIQTIFFPIKSHKGSIERRERELGGMEYSKKKLLSCLKDVIHSYNPIFLWRIQWKCYHNDLVVSTPHKTYSDI